jgi:hypothetical protein
MLYVQLMNVALRLCKMQFVRRMSRARLEQHAGYEAVGF